MPREVYDPKQKELEFYAKREVKPPAPKREVSIFARRWFMFLYGTFLTLVVIGMLLYKKGFFNNIPLFEALKPKTDVIVKINNAEFVNDAVITTIELENSNYTNSESIETLRSYFSLYKNRKLIFTGNRPFNNIRFPVGQRIGFNLSFDKNYWKEANKLEIILQFDNNLIKTNSINTRKIKVKQ
ncbi:hypothetical protein OFR41_12315 [Brachyspira hyodysenteriae]|uniref:hypothetical protein n=1 Tax=Brachyspira hyodysenteriae TaxID=159 RepID=UPI0022CD8E94|nr:hypothetical protein [Brachyspira hyodysenteriae]MDA0035888.1 hypothetical protein [Brachyspira hyodysenteriae]MDA0049977.1 hypothetical protein [Brachyspira hyodysenteriae]MDA1467885.1 hypothetical protein [Brachyspira hyodysenteriae]